MRLPLSVRIARRELRGGLVGFRVFLACLALGVAAIAAVGLVRESIRTGIADQGAVILGGDAQMSFTYRGAEAQERAFVASHAARWSEVVTFRSLAVTGAGAAQQQALTDVKAVDDAYPLVGAVGLSPAMPIAAALAVRDGLPGAVMEPVLAARLGLVPGDQFRLGAQSFTLRALLVREPDNAGAFRLGPRTLVARAALAQSGLLGPGTMYETAYRMLIPPGTDLDRLKAAAEAAFRDGGMRWADRRNAAPGIARFVGQIGDFLVLVGLAGLAVGGVGIAAAVRAYLDGKRATIATLRTLGAQSGLIFRVYLLQIAVLVAIGVVLGLVLGTAAVLLAAPLIKASLPFPLDFAIYPAPLAEAALYGALTAFLFTLWPLARSERLRAAALYRGAAEVGRIWPRAPYLGAMAVLAVALVGGAAGLSGAPGLTLYAAGGVAAALGALALAAWGLRRLARRLARLGALRGRAGLRLALAAIGGPGEAAGSVILSLGLGLAVLAAVGQIDTNLRAAISRDLPRAAPSYFLVDIQPDQLGKLRQMLRATPGVSRIETAPMLRGVIARVNGRPAAEIKGDHWVLRGDRGVTMAARPPRGTTITEGHWWPRDYEGPPQISFAAREAQELGLKLGDTLTVNILGRDITARITSFRAVNFRSMGIGFVMVMDPAALAGAPHTNIATIYATRAAEPGILRAIARDYPNITAIPVRDALGELADALSAIAAATAGAASMTLLTGFIVLIGAAAAGERARIYEAAVLKVLGARRGAILASFALRGAVMGAAAGLVAIAAGGIAGWAVMRFVMHAPYRFEPLSALGIVLGGVLAVLLAGALFALRPLAARPARILREGE